MPVCWHGALLLGGGCAVTRGQYLPTRAVSRLLHKLLPAVCPDLSLAQGRELLPML